MDLGITHRVHTRASLNKEKKIGRHEPGGEENTGFGTCGQGKSSLSKQEGKARRLMELRSIPLPKEN
eukprot:480745-Heterocapsa_arctica.AAC.1